MKYSTLFHKTAALAAMAAAAMLAACGGGDADMVLPIDDASAHAYTDRYLAQHPEALIQPEHLLVVRLDPKGPDGGAVHVRLNVREALAVQIGGPAQDAPAQVLSEVIIEDRRGDERLHYRDGAGPVSVTLLPGEHRVTFIPKRSSAAARTVFMKLARRPSELLVAAPPGGGADDSLNALGVSENCNQCSFDNAQLAGVDMSYSSTPFSTFRNTHLEGANFDHADCLSCLFAYDIIGVPFSQVTFHFATLQKATFSSTHFAFFANDFSSANLIQATFIGPFAGNNFGTYQTQYPTETFTTNLSGANVKSALMETSNSFAWANLSGLVAAPGAFPSPPKNPDEYPVLSGAFVGTRLDDIVPATLFRDEGFAFAGFDLTGTSFHGMDLSTQDFSAASGATIAASTDLSGAVLSNGTTGINMAGHAFPNGYTGFAGHDLRAVNLSGASLYQADLSGVNLSGALLVGANLTGANLAQAKLVGAQLGVTPDDATATAANLTSVYMPSANMTDADLRSVKFDNAHLYGGSTFVRARLDSATFNSAALADADFTQASLTDAQLMKSSIVNANFSGANLHGADFYGSIAYGANFGGTASVAGANLTDAYVSLSSGSWHFTESNGTPFIYGYGATTIGDLGSTDHGVATCPSGESGPCSGNKLNGTPAQIYPLPTPACIPLPPDGANCAPPKPGS